MGGISSSQKHQIKDESSKGAMKPIDSANDDSKNSSDSPMISKLDVLHCYFCFQPLSVPVFQCDNGHIVCSTCYPKLKNKCQKCSLHVSSERCIGIENILLYIGMSCPNTKYGCKEKIVSLFEDICHKGGCVHMPCKCPLLGCNFVASSANLSNHFNRKHVDFLIKFSYHHSFTVSLKSNDETIFLQDENDDKLFILNNRTTDLGNAVNLCCIGPNSSELEYFYDIRVDSPIKTLTFHSLAKIVQHFTSATPSPEFLVIPFDSSRAHTLEICITSPMIQIVAMFNTRENIPLVVKRSDTIFDVKNKIFDKKGIPPVHQNLILDGKKLRARRTIGCYNIQEKTKIHVVLRCTGS